jgi:hypothetical protein
MFPNWKECNDQPNPCKNKITANINTKINISNPNIQCCGNRPYDSTNSICCGNQLFDPYIDKDTACCFDKMYNFKTERCCANGRKSTVCSKGSGCCNGLCRNIGDSCCEDGHSCPPGTQCCFGTCCKVHEHDPCCGTLENPICLKPNQNCCQSVHSPNKYFACDNGCCADRCRTSNDHGSC